MQDDARLSELSRMLGTGAAEVDVAREAIEEYGRFAQPYSDDDGTDDLKQLARALLQARLEINSFIDTLPKKEGAIYRDAVEQRRAKS